MIDHLSPGKIGDKVKSSARIAPAAHMSVGKETNNKYIATFTYQASDIVDKLKLKNSMNKK